jgi:hypothetical protein
MRPRRVAAVVLIALAPALGCSGKPAGPKKEVILPLLQKEAEALKASGEKVDPSLGVQSTWTIEGVDLREQKDESNPWVGTVRFKILTRTKDFDGSSTNDEAKKQFEYVWSAALGKWIFKYTPTPPPRKPS